MPELRVVPTAATEPEVLAAALAASVLAVPGVVRLEPTLSTAGPSLLIRGNPADGVRLVTRTGTTEVDVSITTSAARPARTVTHQIRAGVTSLLTARGQRPGTITVSVLAIEPAPTT